MKTLRSTFFLVLLTLSASQSVLAQTGSQRPPPYPLSEIIPMIEAKFSTDQILREVGNACLGFSVGTNESRLRNAGADAALITALRGLCSRNPEGTPQREGTLNIVGELPTNWTRVVNRIPPNTQRTITLTPGRQATVIVHAPGWCPDTLVLTMQSGENRNWTPALRARPWVGGC
jgi:hypothetical protein